MSSQNSVFYFMFLNFYCQDGCASRFFNYLNNFYFHSFVCFFEESSLRPMSCDVVVVGGGISGMYLAETLMRMKKKDNVCLFEKDSRFGGRDYDYRFSQVPNISISKLVSYFVVTQTEHDLVSCFSRFRWSRCLRG